ncbi:MAG: hypothetical protein KBC16_00870 [Candidatus Pacebacteria bacterium]|nr:hypothetical protein [Candidatus Paceibacterota bacterium]
MSLFFKRVFNSTQGQASLVSRVAIRSASFAPTLLLLFVLFGLAVPHEVHAAATWNPLTWPGAILSGVAKEFAEGAGKLFASFLFVLVQLMAGLLFVVGMGLNWVVLVTVFQFSTYFGNSSGMLLAWTTLRDLANIILLFGFVWIGLQTILNVGHHFSVGKALPRLLIFAILINFSLFISEAIVDVANVFTAVMYEQAGSIDCKQAVNQVDCVNIGISGNVIGAIGFGSLFEPGAFDAYKEIWNSSTDPGQAILAGFLSLIFMIVLVTVFLAASIMLLIRSIVLIFVLVLSPLGFVGMAVPQFEEQAQKWWKMLISNAFFAPVLFLLLFISLKIMEGAKATFGQGVSFAAAVMSPGVNMGGILILFGLMIGFIIFSLIAAKSMGAFGADFATNTAGKMTGAMTLGAGGFVARRTVGRAANWAERKVRDSQFSDTEWGRRTASVLNKGATASFDLRGSNMVKSAAKAGNLDFGAVSKGGSHGYHGIEEAGVKVRTDYAKTLKGRTETQEEFETRKNSLKETADKAEEALIPAQEFAANAERDVETKQQELADLRSQVARTPNNPVLQNKLIQVEQELTQRQAENVKAQKGLSDATTALTEARKAETEATKGRITAKQQQEKYADMLHDKATGALPGGVVRYPGGRPSTGRGVGVTLGEHVFHNASEAIKKEANKSDNDRLKDTIDALAKKTEKLDTSVKSAGSGGGDSHGGGGGDHH